MRDVCQDRERIVVIRDFIHITGTHWECTRFREYKSVTDSSLARLRRMYEASIALGRGFSLDCYGFFRFQYRRPNEAKGRPGRP